MRWAPLGQRTHFLSLSAHTKHGMFGVKHGLCWCETFDLFL